jgi:hypothetical protein
MTDPRPRPCRRELLHAILLAAVCALAFLGTGVLPTRALVPFPPERFEPARSETLARGELDAAQIDRGSPEFGDKYNQSLAWDRILQDRLRSGELPLWSRDIGGGVPFVPQMAQVYQPWNLLLLLPAPSVGMYGCWWLLHVLFWGSSAYWFLRRIGVGHQAALFGLTVACLGLWTQARIHHNVILSAALPLWALLSLVDGAFRGAGLGPGRVALVAAAVGISWSGGFAPVSLQVSFLAGAFALCRALEVGRVRPLLGLAAGCALGAVLALPQMGPTLLAAQDTSRLPAAAEQLRASGLGLAHLRTLIWPDLLNWPAPPLADGGVGPAWAALELLPDAKARGSNYPETAFAVGLPAVLLALLALLVRRDAPTWFFAGVAVLGFGLATAATPFLELSALIPGARAGDLRRFLFACSAGLCVLAALGADRLGSGRRGALLAGLALAIAALSAWPFLARLTLAGDPAAFRELYAERLAGPRTLPDGQVVEVSSAMVLRAMETVRPHEAAVNLAMQTWTYGRTLVVALAAAFLFWRGRPATLLPALLALTALELIAAGQGTIVPVPTERVLALPSTLEPVRAASAAAEAAGQPRPRLFRLEQPGVPPQNSMLFPPNLGAFHRLEDLSAYNPLPKLRMEQLFAAIEPVPLRAVPPIVLGGAGVMAMTDPQTLVHPVLDLLGCRFVLAARRALVAADDPRLVDVTPAGTPAPFRLYERTTTLPRATFVDRAEFVPDPASRLSLLGDARRDFRSDLILEDEAAPIRRGDGVPDAEVEVLHHRDQEVAVRVTAREPGYLRLADPHDAGWTARVDGVPAPLFVADHYVRAVPIEVGTHEVVFRYDGVQARIWPWLGLGGLAVTVLLGAFGLVRRRLERGPPHRAG